MGARVHMLSEKDFDALTAVCAKCGPTTFRIVGNAWQCVTAYHESQARMKKTRTRKGMPPKGDHCEHCGFVALHSCQLDQDHKNGDRTDNSDGNVWTLCSNCHRLKSHHPELFAPLPSGRGA